MKKPRGGTHQAAGPRFTDFGMRRSAPAHFVPEKESHKACHSILHSNAGRNACALKWVVGCFWIGDDADPLPSDV